MTFKSEPPYAASSEFDVERMAKHLIAEHGEQAAFRAATRAYEMRNQGNLEAAAVWLQVRKEIRDLAGPRSEKPNRPRS